MHHISAEELSISDLFKGDFHLASPPNIYFELKKILDNPHKSLIDAAWVIEKDPALSIRLLKIVNSAYYGFPSKIVSIDRAISIIGITEIQILTLSTIVIDRFSDLPGDLMSMHDFWATSLRCALIAHNIDQHLDNDFADDAFICGLLHNIGQLVFFRRIPELAKEVSLIVQALDNPTDVDEINTERSIIGFDHYKAGAELTKLWKLPSIITESLRLHPYPDNAETYHKIASIIRLADSYSKIDLAYYDTVVTGLEISPTDLSTIIDKSYDEFEEIFKVFYPE
ncbi:MAG: HDOD domain-containing protein [Methylococcaceae bacterium]|nr:HDOD domain-containing protein [Methylococcaceae bacterium]